jgi:hypothetical protein
MRARSLLVAFAAALLVPTTAFAEHDPLHPDPHPPAGTFTCTASALRVALLDLEPFVANPGNSPCADDSEGLINVQNPGGAPVRAGVLFATTDADPDGNPGARSEAGAFALTLGSGVQSISVQMLTAESEATCQGGQPTLSGSSQVVGLTAGGMPIIVTGDPQTVPLGPLGTIFLNEKVGGTGTGTITTRALRYEGPLMEIVVGEATADFEGDPCP